MEIRKALGKISQTLSPGYGWCHRCYLSWKFIDGHSTEYKKGSGCFPLCEKCWIELDNAKNRYPFYKELWEDWKKYGDPEITLREIYIALLREDKK